MRSVVDHERPGKGYLHRPPDRLCAQRGEHDIRADEQLAAETTANIGRVDMYLVRRDRQCRREAELAEKEILQRAPDGQLVAVPCRDGGVGLHHRMALVGRGISLVDSDRRCREGALEIADRFYRRPGLVGIGCQRR